MTARGKIVQPYQHLLYVKHYVKSKKYGEWGEAAGTYNTYNYTYKGLQNGKFWV